jgi:hypothetical protein
VYVVVREDLSIPQQAVQACHASIKASRSFLPLEAITHSPNLVVCVVADQAALVRFLAEVRASGIRCAEFHEEDLGGEMTAFATELVQGELRRVFRKCRLLRGLSMAA